MNDSLKDSADQPAADDPRARARARSEAKNQAARESLEPLAPGERPGAVTIAAIAALVLAIGNLIAVLLSKHSVGDDRSQEIIQTLLIGAVLLVAAWGMWRAKYWAVLGFQTILGFQVIFLVLALTRAKEAVAVLIYLAVIAASSVLFWFLIRAMARIQMPEAPDAQKLKQQRETAEEDR